MCMRSDPLAALQRGRPEPAARQAGPARPGLAAGGMPAHMPAHSAGAHGLPPQALPQLPRPPGGQALFTEPQSWGRPGPLPPGFGPSGFAPRPPPMAPGFMPPPWPAQPPQPPGPSPPDFSMHAAGGQPNALQHLHCVMSLWAGCAHLHACIEDPHCCASQPVTGSASSGWHSDHAWQPCAHAGL